MIRKLLVLPALLGAIGPAALVGCAAVGGGAADGGPVIVGTTDSVGVSKDDPAPLDPAVSYQAGSWNIFSNTFQMLLRYPRDGTRPQPDAARNCRFTDTQSEAYSCTLRAGLTFSNGDPLTSRDVQFSVDRLLRINSPVGPASLMSGVSKVETPDDRTVVFYLKASDATFPFKLATPAAAIVDSRVYPADAPYRGLRVVGSGPYGLHSFDPGREAVFSANTRYQGTVTRRSGTIRLRFFPDTGALYTALLDGRVDLTTALDSGQIAGLLRKQPAGVTLTETSGTQAHYLVFDTSPGSPFGNPAVRAALAKLIDREALARDVYQRTVQPLYSVVPQGVTGHRSSFSDAYGDPSAAAAAATLRAAGIRTPVAFTYTYRSTGDLTATAEARWLRRTLNAGGLFDVTVREAPADTFAADAVKGEYQAYGLTRAPDFPDADSYMAPFFGDNFLRLHYVSREIRDILLPRTRRQTDRTATAADFGRAQDIVAYDVPMLPLWQSDQFVACRDDVTGAEWAWSPTSTTQFWELGKSPAG